MEEVWKDIKGYEGLYQVSNFGRVKSLKRKIIQKNGVTYYLKERILKERINKNGYHQVVLSLEANEITYFVHRLVAFAFPEICGEYFEGAEVNHKDENPSNNVAFNLEWVSKGTNLIYGTRTVRSGNKHRKSVLQLSLDGELIKEWESVIVASKELNINKSCISNCCCGRTDTSYGYKWKYKEVV